MLSCCQVSNQALDCGILNRITDLGLIRVIEHGTFPVYIVYVRTALVKA